MTFLDRPLTALRLAFRWSNSIQTWQERIGDLVLIAGVFAAAAWSIGFSSSGGRC
jgi:hypothetical protein